MKSNNLKTEERIANSIDTDGLMKIPGVENIEYPAELNSLILIMKNGVKYRLSVVKEENYSCEIFFT